VSSPCKLKRPHLSGLISFDPQSASESLNCGMVARARSAAKSRQRSRAKSGDGIVATCDLPTLRATLWPEPLALHRRYSWAFWRVYVADDFSCQAAQQRQGAADRQQYRQAAGAPTPLTVVGLSVVLEFF